MDTRHCVNIFLSEGAGVHDIVAQLEARGESVPRDAFGHVKLDKVNPGAYFAKQFAEARRGEGAGAEVWIYGARGAGERRGPGADQRLRDPSRRVRHQGQLGLHRPGRGARRQSEGHRVPAHQGRQGLRCQSGLVPRFITAGELRLIVFTPPPPPRKKRGGETIPLDPPLNSSNPFLYYVAAMASWGRRSAENPYALCDNDRRVSANAAQTT